VLALDEPQERDRRVRGGDDGARRHRRPVGQRDADGVPVADVDPADRRAGADLGAERARGGGEGAGDAAHAAARETPDAGLAVEVAEVVVEHDVRGAGRAWPGPGADHPGDRQDTADGVGLEAGLDEVGDGVGDDADDVDRGPLVDAAQPAKQQRLAGEVGGPAGAEPGRDVPQQRAEERAEAGHVGVPGRVGVGVRPRELRDLGVPLGRLVGEAQAAAVAPRREVRPLRVHVVAVAFEVQGPDQRGRQQRDHVRQRRDRVVGPERVLAHRRPTDHVAGFEHHDRQPLTGQQTRGDEPVVAATDHHDVVFAGDHILDDTD
jgi:hypothetical protein